VGSGPGAGGEAGRGEAADQHQRLALRPGQAPRPRRGAARPLGRDRSTAAR
jgi:hypothetical protein